MKRYLHILIPFILLFSLFLPLICFQINDSLFQPDHIAWDSSNSFQSDIPLIANLYSNHYRSISQENSKSYDLTNLEENQKEILPIKNQFTTQINALLDQQLLFPSYMGQIEDTFVVSFGNLSIFYSEAPYLYTLNQIFYLDGDTCRSIDYTMDANTNKIISCTIYIPEQIAITDEERTQFLQNYIQYLELNELIDWTNNSECMESYQGKVQVYMDISSFANQYQLTFGIVPLGLHASNNYTISRS